MTSSWRNHPILKNRLRIRASRPSRMTESFIRLAFLISFYCFVTLSYSNFYLTFSIMDEADWDFSLQRCRVHLVVRPQTKCYPCKYKGRGEWWIGKWCEAENLNAVSTFYLHSLFFFFFGLSFPIASSLPSTERQFKFKSIAPTPASLLKRRSCFLIRLWNLPFTAGKSQATKTYYTNLYGFVFKLSLVYLYCLCGDSNSHNTIFISYISFWTTFFAVWIKQKMLEIHLKHFTP